MYVDKKLSGIQAVQTLSRLNRSYPGKDTTYVVDFINEPDDILAAFKTYYNTAELSGVSDPNLVYDLRMKLDGAGYYDDFEIDRVVSVELNEKSKQSDLVAAIEPVSSRILQIYKNLAQDLKDAKSRNDAGASADAQNGINALLRFKKDIGTFQRVYSFLSQIFDYGNTAIEKRHMFFKRLLPLLEFGREREGIDLSKLVLTHHTLKNKGKQNIPLGAGKTSKLDPITDAGSGSVNEKEKIRLRELIAKLNELFEGELTDNDRLVYVNNALKGKLLESEILRRQENNNTKEQFANSPDLTSEIMNAIIDAFAAHNTMSKQALDSERVRTELRNILLEHGKLYEDLREMVNP